MSHQKKYRHLNRRGFTLLEIIVVVMIIAVLATLIAPRLLGRVGTAKRTAAIAKAATIAKTVNLYTLDMGLSSPGDDFDLEVLWSVLAAAPAKRLLRVVERKVGAKPGFTCVFRKTRNVVVEFDSDPHSAVASLPHDFDVDAATFFSDEVARLLKRKRSRFVVLLDNDCGNAGGCGRAPFEVSENQ